DRHARCDGRSDPARARRDRGLGEPLSRGGDPLSSASVRRPCRLSSRGPSRPGPRRFSARCHAACQGRGRAHLAPDRRLHAGRARRGSGPGKSFWLAYAGIVFVAAPYWACFEGDYAYKAYTSFSSLQSRLLSNYFAWRGSWVVVAMLLVTLLAVFGFVPKPTT